MRTNIYVDGFNLYYGALRKTPHRWVNLKALFVAATGIIIAVLRLPH